jgi:hypothetical protein
LLLCFTLKIRRLSYWGGIDEPTGSAYDDLYFAEENATNTLGLNQTVNENNAEIQK